MEGCEPLREILIVCEPLLDATAPEASFDSFAWAAPQVSKESDIIVAMSSFIASSYNLWEREKLEARKIFEKAGESPASNARFVSQLFA
jgi:hypothetical protein